MTSEGKSDVTVVTTTTQLIYVSVLPDCILAVAIALGWYVRYNFYENSAILYVGAIGLLLIGSNLCLKYYFGVRFSHILFNVWNGCLLMVLALFDINELTDSRQSNLEDIVHILLISTLTCDVACCIVQKCCVARGSVSCARDMHLETHGQVCIAIGVTIGTLLSGHNPLPYLSLLLALLCCVVALHMQNTLAVALLFFLILVAEKFVMPLTRASINPYAMLAIVGRLTISSLIELVWPFRSRLDRWRPFMTSGRCWHLLVLVCVICIEVTFLAAHVLVISNHKEWFVVVPMFICAALLFSVVHLAGFAIYSALAHRFRQAFNHPGTSIMGAPAKTVLAATGLRYFALLASRLCWVCLMSSLLLGALCWTTPSAYTHSLLVAVVALELAFLDLLQQLARSIGGTCCGYTMVAPIVNTRNDGLVTLMPPSTADGSSARSTRQLQTVLNFFQANLITNFGADWSMKGMSDKDLETRLEEFFAQTTSAGPRYDTYLIYFSGPTIEETGDWALAQGSQLSLNRVLSLWDACNVNRSSRLLLVVDAPHGYKWLPAVKQSRTSAVALQTFYYKHSRKVVPEDYDGNDGGAFTQLWTQTAAEDHHNVTATIESLRERYRPSYAVSRSWTSFEFHQPSATDVTDYSSKVIPHMLHCCCLRPVLLCLAIQPSRTLASISPCCSGLLSAIQTGVSRCRMKLWPPQRLDTQHGFALIM